MTTRITSTLLASALILLPSVSSAQHEPAPFSTLLESGYVASVYATGAPGPASLEFGPDGNLYVATVSGTIFRFDDLEGAAAAPGAPTPIVVGLNYALGIDFDDEGFLYFTALDSEREDEERSYSYVGRVALNPGAPSEIERLVVDIPNGLSLANSVVFGPDDKLYIANGASTDDGVSGGPPEVPYLTGAILRFDPDDVTDRPLSAQYHLGSGASSEDPVEVVAYGLRNPYDLAFRGDDLYMTMNGPDSQEPYGDDLLYRVPSAAGVSLDAGNAPDFGFPGCVYTHDELGHPVGGPSLAPGLAEELKGCDGVPAPIASYGLHPSANGVDVAPESFGRFGGDVFAAEWGSFSGYQGHKVVRVGLTQEGSPADLDTGEADVADFMVAGSPIDLTFHQGAMFVADFDTGSIYRVAPLPDPPTPAEYSHLIVRYEYVGSLSTSKEFTGTPEGLYSSGFTVRRDDRIRFTNLDDQPHTVTSCSPCDPAPIFSPDFKSSYLFQGDEWVLDTTNLEPGTYKYFCQHHVGIMRGSVTVI